MLLVQLLEFLVQLCLAHGLVEGGGNLPVLALTCFDVGKRGDLGGINAVGQLRELGQVEGDVDGGINIVARQEAGQVVQRGVHVGVERHAGDEIRVDGGFIALRLSDLLVQTLNFGIVAGHHGQGLVPGNGADGELLPQGLLIILRCELGRFAVNKFLQVAAREQQGCGKEEEKGVFHGGEGRGRKSAVQRFQIADLVDGDHQAGAGKEGELSGGGNAQ